MARSHNKKRNVGIIYELLLRHISKCLIEEKMSDAQKSLNILDKGFSKGTELYKEFRLFNALANSTVSDTPVAAAILTEAKQAARRTDINKLDREKSILIKEINYNIKDSDFYSSRIPQYKIFATIQTLLNDWREEDISNLSRMVQYESKIVGHLLEEKSKELIDDHVERDVDSLVVKILSEKFNKKYSDSLDDTQKDIIRTYVFSMSSDDYEPIKKMLLEIREETVDQINKLKTDSKNEILLEKADNVKDQLLDLDIDNISDESISRFLVVSQLKHTLVGGLNE